MDGEEFSMDILIMNFLTYRMYNTCLFFTFLFKQGRELKWYQILKKILKKLKI